MQQRPGNTPAMALSSFLRSPLARRALTEAQKPKNQQALRKLLSQATKRGGSAGSKPVRRGGS